MFEKKIKNFQAFTLIELIISLAIITTTILAAMSIFLYVFKTQEKIVAQSDIQDDGIFVLEKIAHDIRYSYLDYDYYTTGITTPEDELALKDTLGNQIIYRRAVSGSIYQVERKFGTGAFEPLTKETVTVDRLDFYISPTSNPFLSGSTIYKIPKVTIVLEIKSTRETYGSSPIYLEETIPQRYEYKQ